MNSLVKRTSEKSLFAAAAFFAMCDLFNAASKVQGDWMYYLYILGAVVWGLNMFNLLLNRVIIPMEEYHELKSFQLTMKENHEQK